MSGAVSPRTRVFLHGTGGYVRARWLCRSVARSVVMPGVRGMCAPSVARSVVMAYAGQRTVNVKTFGPAPSNILVLEYRYRVTPRNGVPSVE